MVDGRGVSIIMLRRKGKKITREMKRRKWRNLREWGSYKEDGTRLNYPNGISAIHFQTLPTDLDSNISFDFCGLTFGLLI